MVHESDIIDSLKDVEDPEMKLSVIELGLIYGIRVEENDDGTHAEIDMTLTSPGCPVAPEIMAAVHRSALATEGVESAEQLAAARESREAYGIQGCTHPRTLRWIWVSSRTSQRP